MITDDEEDFQMFINERHDHDYPQRPTRALGLIQEIEESPSEKPKRVNKVRI
jgi:hypothetical protein